MGTPHPRTLHAVTTPDVSRCDAGCVSIYQEFQRWAQHAGLKVGSLWKSNFCGDCVMVAATTSHD
jgi:hypothetical protein